MNKIGILYGRENSFPFALAERINEKKVPDIQAEYLQIDKVIQGRPLGFAVIIDRISQDVPFYRAFLKNEAITGTAVMNNPFWWSADDRFFNNALALKIGVTVPRTVILPSKQHPTGTESNSFRNMKYPLNWDAIFNYVGFPAYFKPFAGDDGKNVYRVENIEQFFRAYDETGQLVMMLQEEIVYTDYFRCYAIDRKDVHIMQCDPNRRGNLRPVKETQPKAKALFEKIATDVLALNKALGYDFNTVEFAVRNGIPYAIDIFNPVPKADIDAVGDENFNWIVEAATAMAIRRAQNLRPGMNNCTWGEFLKDNVADAL